MLPYCRIIVSLEYLSVREIESAGFLCFILHWVNLGKYQVPNSDPVNKSPPGNRVCLLLGATD